MHLDHLNFLFQHFHVFWVAYVFSIQINLANKTASNALIFPDPDGPIINILYGHFLS